MKELKTDPKLKALFKPLSKEKLEELEEKISKKYDGTPLYVWKGNRWTQPLSAHEKVQY